MVNLGLFQCFVIRDQAQKRQLLASEVSQGDQSLGKLNLLHHLQNGLLQDIFTDSFDENNEAIKVEQVAQSTLVLLIRNALLNPKLQVVLNRLVPYF